MQNISPDLTLTKHPRPRFLNESNPSGYLTIMFQEKKAHVVNPKRPRLSRHGPNSVSIYALNATSPFCPITCLHGGFTSIGVEDTFTLVQT